jgi:Cu-Zn family superoxide dismutase
VGTVAVAEVRAGLLVSGTVRGLGLGQHGIHIHAVGKCEAPFTTAGGHLNPNGHKHGFRSADGPHMGDMPNIDTPAAGQYKFEYVVAGVRLSDLLDSDGAAIVIHAGRDDYMTDPAGNSGGRIACGVITAAK